MGETNWQLNFICVILCSLLSILTFETRKFTRFVHVCSRFFTLLVGILPIDCNEHGMADSS